MDGPILRRQLLDEGGYTDIHRGQRGVSNRNNYYKVRPEEFLKRVRRFPRDELLRGIAGIAAGETRARNSSFMEGDEATRSAIYEGYLFQVAGICVTHCNNHRRAPVTKEAINDLVNRCLHTWDPELEGPASDIAWQRDLSRIAYLQMPFQMSRAEPLTRTLCLFGSDLRFGPPLFDDDWWNAELGVTISQFLKIAFGMYAAAIHNDGAISRKTLLADNVRPVFEPVSPARGLRAVDSWLARPIGELARVGRKNAPSIDDLWRFNPLYEYPIAIMDDHTYVISSPRALLQRLGPQGLYFIVRDALDADANPKQFREFTKVLGIRFQHYVGEQLGLLHHATIHPETTYDSGKKTVDYIVETPQVLVLVEAKSVSPNVHTRSGVFPSGGDFDRNLNRACDQISRTAGLIRRGHPDLPTPDGRPLRGLIITREDYFNLPMPYIGDMINPASEPTTVVSSHQLEYVLSGLSNDLACGSLLLEALASDTNRIKTHLDPLPTGENPLLKKVWDRWSEEIGLPLSLPSPPEEH